MSKIAILDATLAARVRERPQDLEGIDVVGQARDLEGLRRIIAEEQPEVVAVSMSELGDDPAVVARELAEFPSVKMVTVLFSFAPRETLKHFAREPFRALKNPVSPSALRATMMSLIIKEIFSTTDPTGSKDDGGDVVSARRYSKEQLGRLQEISSAVQCECPNNAASLVSNLLDFEDYSSSCEDRNDADAKIHRMLFEQTARARAIMENALAKLCEFEGIEL